MQPGFFIGGPHQRTSGIERGHPPTVGCGCPVLLYEAGAGRLFYCFSPRVCHFPPCGTVLYLCRHCDTGQRYRSSFRPPQALGRDLTLVTSFTTVLLLDGSTEIASHPRSYDRHDVVEDPAHHQAVRLRAQRIGRSSYYRSTPSPAHVLLEGFVKTDGEFTGAIVIAHPRLSSVAVILALRHRQSRQVRCRPRCPSIFRAGPTGNLTVSHLALEVYDEPPQDPPRT